jgi:AraC-like DNA-binding protein
MKIQNICPILYGLSYFKYIEGDHKYPRFSFDKSQYVYHVLLLDKGALDVYVGGQTKRLKAGDALYLLPGDTYRLLPCGEDFSLYNLFFDFLDDRPIKENSSNTCVFMKYYNAQLCLPRIKFEDAEILNKSDIIKNISCEKALKSLLYIPPTDDRYCFYGKSALFSVITDILASEQKSEKKSRAVEHILEYIKTNPEKDLSGDGLAQLFSYHKNHINKLIKSETGRNLGEYVRYTKVEYAKMLLSEGLYSTSEIAIMLGYYDYSHFYKAFLLETGTRPTEYLPIKR